MRCAFVCERLPALLHPTPLTIASSSSSTGEKEGRASFLALVCCGALPAFALTEVGLDGGVAPF